MAALNELEFAGSQDPDVMLRFVLDKTTERKLRLCGCACLRRVWPPPPPPVISADALDKARAHGNEWVYDQQGRFCWPRGDAVLCQAADAAERFADGRASEAELRTWFEACRALADRAASDASYADHKLGDDYGLIELISFRQTAASYLAAMFTCAPTMAQALPQHWGHLEDVLFPHARPVEAVRQAVRAASLATFNSFNLGGESYAENKAYVDARKRAQQGERVTQGVLLGDIWGNTSVYSTLMNPKNSPFHSFHPLPLDPAWLSWNDGCIVSLAQAIYDERRFGDMPLLSDALLDAGCDDEAMLAHCRSTVPHVRGCWLLDLLLGKR